MAEPAPLSGSLQRTALYAAHVRQGARQCFICHARERVLIECGSGRPEPGLRGHVLRRPEVFARVGVHHHLAFERFRTPEVCEERLAVRAGTIEQDVARLHVAMQHVMFVDEIPQSFSGKVLRKLLR